MIYGRFGDEVTILRRGTLADVQTLDNRKPDQRDRDNVANDAYVVVQANDNGQEYLYHLAYLRADNGLTEIMEVLATLQPVTAEVDVDAARRSRSLMDPDYSRDHN